MKVTERVEALRAWMKKEGLEAYIIPTADPHNDEYIPARWMAREWISGFTGSAGTAVVTATEAVLWTDSRYWLQATAQLADTPFILMRDGEPDVPDLLTWLRERLPKGMKAGCPADMLTVAVRQEAEQTGVELVSAADAFDTIWEDRPGLPDGVVTVQSEMLAGMSVADKLKNVRQVLQKEIPGRDYIVNDLSHIAWLLNLRGNEIPYNPVFLSYLRYEAATDSFILYVQLRHLTEEARRQLEQCGVRMEAYSITVRKEERAPKAFDFSIAPCCLHDDADDRDFALPVEQWRAVKTEAEQEGFREAMRRDGVAMVRFLHWLDRQMAAGEEVTELSADERLTAERAVQPGFRDLSFATIAGYGAHGAIVHYEADCTSNVRLEPHGLLLLDSGAQYDCGTTDITRTIALGKLTEEEKRVYTLVLKGHLALSRQHFPKGTTGLQLDLAARSAMWAAGYDFGHGTGHGVGSHLCVHEGPHQIRKNVRACTLVPFEPGMVVTNEPGVYVEGHFGVRIENMLLCVADRMTAFGDFCRFETLTLCPYDVRAIDFRLLTAYEVRQLNIYHARVRDVLLPLLTDSADAEWLLQATRELPLPEGGQEAADVF